MIIWITWEKQIRNRSMCKALGVPLFEILSGEKRIHRYNKCIKKTISILRSESPDVVVCQNPSLVLSLFLLTVRYFYQFKVVIDAHFGGMEAYNGSKALQHILDHCNKSADLVIVTNKAHSAHVFRIGGNAFVFPDPLPDLSVYSSNSVEVPRKVFFICSYDPDEPYLEVFRAARTLIDDGFSFFASGNFRKAGINPINFPHITFLGYAPEDEYYRHLFSSELVIDLTNNDNCLVCGAYEALEARKPLILSDKKALKEYFTGGTVFTSNYHYAIVNAVRDAHSRRLELKKECEHWVETANEQMRIRIELLKKQIERL